MFEALMDVTPVAAGGPSWNMPGGKTTFSTGSIAPIFLILRAVSRTSRHLKQISRD
jgi:hypothetical protein